MDLLSIRSIFTPSVLFLLLNLVIGTIAVISARHRRTAARGGDQQQQHQEQQGGGPRPIARSSSSNVLERVRSLGLFRFRSGDLPSVDDTDTETDDGVVHEVGHQQQFRRIQSESDSKVKENDTIKMKKSASSMPSRRSEEGGERGPATSKLRRQASVDEEVDAKADDFINRFKQQLKLQRLDSILRYKEMLTNKK